MRSNAGLSLVVAMLIFGSAAPAAAEVDVGDVPEDLQPWVGWVLHDVPDVVCPDLNGTRACVWPGELDVEATAEGASWAMSVYADRETMVGLPGGKEQWPQDVRVDGRAGILGASGETPTVKVGAGTHRITGGFDWSQVPEVIQVPSQVGQVSLTLEDKPVDRPRVAEGRLWLRDGTGELGQAEEDSLRASVYRKIADGVPLTVTTRIRLNVSGRAREVSLGSVLLDGSRPVEVRAPLPVQVNVDGGTKVYVRPGTHDVEIDAVVNEKIETLGAPSPSPEFYDPQEVWIWVPDESVRSVELGGLTSVDPERTSLPDDWKGHTTFLAEPGGELTLKVTRRGIPEPPPNEIHLARDLWLDLDGRGYTIQDRLTGSIHQEWRLDYSSEGGAKLGRVTQSGENLLITEDPDSKAAGVELRNTTLDATAEIRVEDALHELPIVGWEHDVQSLRANLHLPPGWTVLWGSGVDELHGTLANDVTLWDFFFVLMVALVIGRLFGWPWVPITLLALALSHGHEDAPQWVWIHLIVSLALLRVLPEGLWRKLVVVYRAGALVGLVIIFAPFAHDQVLESLHPQVSIAQPAATSPMPVADRFANVAMEGEQVAKEAAPITGRGAPVQKKTGAKQLWASSNYDGKARQVVDLQQVDPNAVVQTGPGLPDWEWSNWTLEWTGPVREDHEIRLYLVSPTWNAVLGFVRVALLLLLSILLVAPRDMYWDRKRRTSRWWPGGWFRKVATVAIAVGTLGAFGPRDAFAETNAMGEPPPNDVVVQQQSNLANVQAQGLTAGAKPTMLDELRERLVEQTRCPSPCVVASEATIAIDGLQFRMDAEVSAQKKTGWALPGPMDRLRIADVRVDGRRTTALRQEPGGLVYVRLEEGSHTVSIQGELADRNVVTIQFDAETRPRHVTFAAPSWTVDGISPSGVPDNSLQLTRTVDTPTEADEAAAGATELPPWYYVERHVALGLPWQIETIVRRDDASRPQLVKVPLVKGEKVITEGTRVEDGHALVDFGRGEQVVTFVGEIPVSGEVELTAAEDEPWTENWVVECSRIWRCSFSDLPPVSSGAEVWSPVWKPWPGESLTISVKRPEGAPGQPKTVENVRYEVTPGKRLLQATLTLDIRASQGDWQEVTIPPDAELQTVTVNGSERTIRPQNQVVRLPVQPGSNSFVLNWQQPWKRGTTERVPEIDIGSEATNVRVVMKRGGERWLIAVRNAGLRWGPAILFWPHLIILLVLALVLSTFRGLPLKWHEWFLLVIGMSQLPVVVMLPVVFWFVLLAWRGRDPQKQWWKFDLVQLGCVFMTLAAIGALYAAVHTNLLVDIDMQVDGAGSTNRALTWYADRVDGTLPTPAILSVHVLVWRVIMFLWALWLVWRLINWAKWGWTRFSTDGWWRTPRSGKDGDSDSGDSGDGGPVRSPTPDGTVDEVPRNAKDGELVKKEYPLSSREEE
jgi:hypothetical protein